jgi:hypothetical protein
MGWSREKRMVDNVGGWSKESGGGLGSSSESGEVFAMGRTKPQAVALTAVLSCNPHWTLHLPAGHCCSPEPLVVSACSSPNKER